VYLNGATIITTPTARQVEIARAAGYDGVEVRTERLLESPDEMREAAAIVRPGEIWGLCGLAFQLRPDETLDRERLDVDVAPRLEICRVLGASYLLVAPPRRVVADRGKAMHAMQEAVAIARDRAAAQGVKVAFEFQGFEDCPISTPAQAGEVVAGVPGVEVLIDVFHWQVGGSGPLDAFPVDRLAMVHLNDVREKPRSDYVEADRVLPGQGTVADSLVRELRARGYTGPWSLETFNPGYWAQDPLRIAQDGRRQIGELLGEAAARSD
jgi:2-keto-myo-inositol isomerase